MNLIKRYIVLLVGLTIMSFGVAFSINANLGTSPISSPPYVISLFTPLSVGNLTILMHCIFIVLQILLLRKRYDPIQLLQLPAAIVFGFLTDFALYVIQDITYTGYLGQWVLCMVGIVLVAIGVSCEVIANVVTLAGEGLILAICKVTNVAFDKMKVVIDASLVVLACIISYLFLHTIEGVREGTLAAAILVGVFSGQINHAYDKWKEKSERKI